MTYFNYLDMEDYLYCMKKFEKTYKHISEHLEWWFDSMEPTAALLHYKQSGDEHLDTESGENVLGICEFTEAFEYARHLANQDNALDHQIDRMYDEMYA